MNCYELLDNIAEVIVMLDKDGFIQYCNATTASLTGYPVAELLKKPFSALYDGHDAIKAEYDLTQTLKNGKLVAEGWRTRKDGSRFWGEISLSVVYNDLEQPAGFSCVLKDLSQRKKYEVELKQNEERFRLMVESVRDYAIFLLDATGHIQTWNEGAKRLKGYSYNEIKGKHFSIFYTARDLEDGKPARELKIATATGKYEEEGWRVKKDGSLFWANVVITALYNESNKLVGFSKVTRDLTERRQNEDALRQSEERYRALSEQVVDYGIFLMDEKGRVASWNEGAKRINGYTAEEIIGKHFSIFYPEEDIINGKPGMELKVAMQVGKYEEEGWRLRKDGSRFWANVVITALYNPEGAHIGFSKVTRDLTEKKEAERALRHSYDQYRHLAEELKTANDRLTYANSELEQFTSIVSHDLQEPVRTIKSFLQLIDKKTGDDKKELKVYITKSVNAANRMRELIRNLLHYSQLDKDEMQPALVQVADVVNEAVQNLRSAIEASGASISVDSEVESVYGDKVQLVQLIQNLLSNALKFTNGSEPQISIKCSKEKGHVKFAVTDNGIGIEGGDLTKVFEIFRRLNTEKEYPGTGIGLAICKKIVDRHKGRIWPESKYGKGTTFYFTLNEETTDKPTVHEKV